MLGRYRTVIASAVLASIVAAVVATVAATGSGDSGTTDAVALPTACDNLVAAAEAVANSRAIAPHASTTNPLEGGTASSQYETFKTLLEACESERGAAASG